MTALFCLAEEQQPRSHRMSAEKSSSGTASGSSKVLTVLYCGAVLGMMPTFDIARPMRVLTSGPDSSCKTTSR